MLGQVLCWALGSHLYHQWLSLYHKPGRQCLIQTMNGDHRPFFTIMATQSEPSARGLENHNLFELQGTLELSKATPPFHRRGNQEVIGQRLYSAGGTCHDCQSGPTAIRHELQDQRHRPLSQWKEVGSYCPLDEGPDHLSSSAHLLQKPQSWLGRWAGHSRESCWARNRL